MEVNIKICYINFGVSHDFNSEDDNITIAFFLKCKLRGVCRCTNVKFLKFG